VLHTVYDRSGAGAQRSAACRAFAFGQNRDSRAAARGFELGPGRKPRGKVENGTGPRSGDTAGYWPRTMFCRIHFNPSVRLVPILCKHFTPATSLSRGCLRGCSQTEWPAERMHSLVQKFRSLLEASWAVSPTMVGSAWVTLDLAALLRLRIKATHPGTVQTVRERRPRE